MAQVTIGELTEDLLPFTEKGNKVITIPIVPRKIVEDIISLCEEEYLDTFLTTTAREEARKIGELAKIKLFEFEEGGAGVENS